MSFSLVNVFRNPETQNYLKDCRALTKKPFALKMTTKYMGSGQKKNEGRILISTS